jgi:Sulfotransferase domain
MPSIPIYKRIARKGEWAFCKWAGRIFPPLPQSALFPSDMIVHFSYHKCLTAYFGTIMWRLGEEFNFSVKHFRTDLQDFEKAALFGKGKRVLSLNNSSGIDFAKFPSYKGSHFIRDPRDLVVSGYRYHLWTNEVWCVAPDFDWSEITGHPYFAQYIEQDHAKFPHHISYQEYLKKLDIERGLILELVWRQFGFTAMEEWQPNPNIIEFRYEDIVGNEVAAFRKIFEHYEFHPKLMRRGLQLVDEHSLKNTAKGEKSHVRKGTAAQWKSEFTPLVKDAFKKLNGDLLIHLGYEQNENW